MDFIRQLLSGRKKMLKMSRVNFCPPIERYRKLSVKHLVEWSELNVPTLRDFLPDVTNFSSLDRTYVLNVSFYAHQPGDEHD
jgi:hypothetical protein